MGRGQPQNPVLQGLDMKNVLIFGRGTQGQLVQCRDVIPYVQHVDLEDPRLASRQTPEAGS